MASNDLAKLVVKLEAQTSQYQAELEKAKRQLGKFDSDVSKIAGKIGKSIGVAIAGAATGIAFAVKQSLDAADELGNLSEKVGVSVEALSKLQYAAKLSDVSAEQLQVGLLKLSKSAVEAANGTGDASAAFSALGVGAKKADGSLKSTDELFIELAESFSKFEDGPEKAAAAMAIFGKSGAELIPLLNAGKQGIQSYSDELEKLGGVVTAEASARADEFNRNLDRLKGASAGLANQLATALSPALVELAQRMVRFTSDSEASGKVIDGLKVSFRGLVGTAIVLANALQIVGQASAANYAAIVALGEGKFSEAADILKQAFDDLKGNIEDITHAFDEQGSTVKATAETTVAASTESAKATLNYAAAVEDAKNKTKEAKDITDAWALSLMAAQEIQEEADNLDTERKETQSRQDDLGLTAADEIQVEADRLDGIFDEVLARQAEFKESFSGAFEAYAASISNVSATLGGDLVTALDSAMSATADLAAETLLWGNGGKEALKALGRSIITDVVSSLIKAGLQMAANFALQKIFTAGAAAESAGLAGATATAWAPAAIAASTATFGGAAAAGLSGYLSALAVGEAATLAAGAAGFAEGGYTGDGPKNEIAGLVHRGEYVLNAKAVNNLDAMNEGRMPWDHARVEAANEPTVNIVNQPGIVTVRQDDGTLLNRLAPQLLEMVDVDQAGGLSSGLSRTARAMGEKFGVQGRAVR